jgi:hypothetical protein
VRPTHRPQGRAPLQRERLRDGAPRAVSRPFQIVPLLAGPPLLRGAKGATSSEAMSSALGLIEARARFDGREIPVHVRVAGHAGKLYLDLADSQWRAVEIDADGGG